MPAMPKPQPTTYHVGMGAGFPLFYTVLITMLAGLMLSSIPASIWELLRALALAMPILIIGLLLLWISRRRGATELGPDGLLLRINRRKSVSVTWADIAELRVHQLLTHRHVMLRTKQNEVHVLPAPRTALLAPDREFEAKVDNLTSWWRTAEPDAKVPRVRLVWSAAIMLAVVLAGYLYLVLRNAGAL